MSRDEVESCLDAWRDRTDLSKDDMFHLIKIFNRAMLSNVTGPDCTDRMVCQDNCCSIMIDIPDFLAWAYVEGGYLEPHQIRRGTVFAWTLSVDPVWSDCVFLDRDSRKCRIYVENLDIRPPQCAVYPAGFIKGNQSCKGKAGPWTIIDIHVGNACKELMEIYKMHALREFKMMERSIVETLTARLKPVMQEIACFRPSKIAGIRDAWEGFTILEAEGISLSLSRICRRVNPKCITPFTTCKSLCNQVASFFEENIPNALATIIQEDGMKEKYLLKDLVFP
ncbi:hypothetical protein GF325_14805 [Candidatus Bathyarchaeota archaeon]|nr:hypothetical protein [Candidatus Bathyarchaeota archaeon]